MKDEKTVKEGKFMLRHKKIENYLIKKKKRSEYSKFYY